MALPGGFRQHLATIGAGGQIQNITVQQTGTNMVANLEVISLSNSETSSKWHRQKELPENEIDTSK